MLWPELTRWDYHSQSIPRGYRDDAGFRRDIYHFGVLVGMLRNGELRKITHQFKHWVRHYHRSK